MRAEENRGSSHPFRRKTAGGSSSLRFPVASEEGKALEAFSLSSFPPFTSHLTEAKLREQDRKDLEEIHTVFGGLAEVDLAELQQAYRQFGVDYVTGLTAELVSKVLVYRESLAGEQVRLPYTANGKTKLADYSIRYISIGKNLPVLVLQSADEEAPSWIVPRGTSLHFGARQGVLESIQADLARKEGIDLEPIHQARDRFQGLASELLDSGGPVYLAGHSLGGAFATRMAMDLGEKVDQTFTFCAPFMCDDTKMEYEQLPVKPKIVQFFTQGDAVPLAGRYLLGTGIAVNPKSYRRLASNAIPVAEHICMTLNQDHEICLVDREAEEGRKSRRFTEQGLRRLFGSFFRLPDKLR